MLSLNKQWSIVLFVILIETLAPAEPVTTTPLRVYGPGAVIRPSPDGILIGVTGTALPDNTAKLWEAATGSELRTFSGHEGEVHSVAFSPDGTKLLTGSWDKTAGLWRVSTGTGTGARR